MCRNHFKLNCDFDLLTAHAFAWRDGGVAASGIVQVLGSHRPDAWSAAVSYWFYN